MTGLVDLLMEAIVQFFAGMAPERPLWLRRTVQAVWLCLAALLVVVWGLGGTLLVQAL